MTRRYSYLNRYGVRIVEAEERTSGWNVLALVVVLGALLGIVLDLAGVRFA